MGHCVLSFVSSDEILCGLVILVCSANRSILDLDRFNPFCREYGFRRRFFRLISGVGQNGGLPLMGHCVLSFVSSNEILCGLVILVCGGNRSILDLDRFNPFCREYGSLRWFFKLISGVGQDGGVSLVGHCVLSFVSTSKILCGVVILVCGGNRSILDLNRLNPLCSKYGFRDDFSHGAKVCSKMQVCRSWGIVSFRSFRPMRFYVV